MRQIAGSFAKYEKGRLVKKLPSVEAGNPMRRHDRIRSRSPGTFIPMDCPIARSQRNWRYAVTSPAAVSPTLLQQFKRCCKPPQSKHLTADRRRQVI
jgi:hypothetical protein